MNVSPKKNNRPALKQVILSLFSIALIVSFFSLPLNSEWVASRIIPYLANIPDELQHLDLHERKRRRWGYGYPMTNFLKEYMDSSSVFLIPPQTYFVEKTFRPDHRQQHRWLYPSLLYYYYEDLKMVDMRSSDSLLATATHSLYIDDQGVIRIQEIPNDRIRSELLSLFRTYELKNFHTPEQAETWLKQQHATDD